jgi:hypothetical protein
MNPFSLVSAFRRQLYRNLALFTLVIVVVSTFLILRFESGYPDSQIRTLNDALWWSAVGVSTIGIGNVVPESQSGKYLTLFLMVAGVVIFSVITAKIASIFTEEEVKQDLDKDIKIIQGGLSKVEHDIEGEIAVEDKAIEDKIVKIEKTLKKLEKKN